MHGMSGAMLIHAIFPFTQKPYLPQSEDSSPLAQQNLLLDSLFLESKSLSVQNTYARECVALVFFSLFLLLFSRAVFVFPILYAHNHWAEQKLRSSEIVVSW